MPAERPRECRSAAGWHPDQVAEPPDLRASDADREQTVRSLRDHALAGRLTVDELDERSERAFASRTIGELAELTADLPAAPRAAPAAQPVDPGGLGRRPFTYTFEYPVAPDTAMDAALRSMAPALARGGYALVHREPRRLEFEYAYRPGWVALPVILFPGPGFLALLIKEHDRVSVDFEETGSGGTRLVVRGVAPRRVRRAFAELGR
jgi:hypothetical protein